ALRSSMLSGTGLSRAGGVSAARAGAPRQRSNPASAARSHSFRRVGWGRAAVIRADLSRVESIVGGGSGVPPQARSLVGGIGPPIGGFVLFSLPGFNPDRK